MIDENSSLDERYEKCGCGDYKVEHCEVHDKYYCLICDLNCTACKDEEVEDIDDSIYKNKQGPYVF